MTDQTATPGNPDTSTANANDKTAADAAALAAAGGDATSKAAADKAAADKATADRATADAAATAKAPTWGEKWREEYAGTDEKVLKRLQRYTTPKAALDAMIEAQNKISDGSFKKLPANATTEQIAEYRKANGIPETAGKYLDQLPDGLVIGDEDKPFIEKFAKAFHDKNADPAIVHAAIKTYYDVVDEQEGLRQELNASAKTATEDALRAEWGPDYRPNTNLINAFIGSMPKDLQEELFQSAKPDGTQIMNNPAMLKWLAQQARELNYTGAVLPNGEASAKSLESEITQIKTLMGDRSSKYWKGPESAGLQARYRELLDIQQKIANRAA